MGIEAMDITYHAGVELWVLAKRKVMAEELGARAEPNSYRRGAHREKDSTRDNGKHNKKTIRNQNSV